MAAFCTLLIGSLWSACSVDDRHPNVIGNTGLGGASGIASLLGQDPNSPVQITPSTIDLGPVVVGAPARARLHIANNGMLPLDPPSVSLGAGSDPAFSILHDSCAGTPVPPGQECDVLVQLFASQPGNIAGQLAIAAAGSSANVPLSAIGNAAGAMILAPAVGSSDDFGSVRLSTSVQEVFNLTNAGGIASGPVSVHIYDADVTPVVGMAGGCSSGQTSLAPGQSCDINLTYGPSRRGAANALLVVTSAGAGSVSLPLTGRGTVAGVLGVSQPSLDFGGIALGDAGQRALHVVNQGDEPLVLVGTTLDSARDFSIVNSDCTGGRTLGAGAGCDVISEFRPALSGDGQSASLTVAMTDGSPEVVRLTGAGLDPGSLTITPVAGENSDFGSVLLGAQSTQVFQVTNGSAQNSGPLALSASGDFTLVAPSQPGDCESGQTALDAAGATCNITVQLTPARRAAQYGSLSVRSPLGKSASLALKGVGTAPAHLALVQDEINFGHVLTGGTYQTAVTVINQGDQALTPPLPTLVDPAGNPPPGFSVDSGCSAPIAFGAACPINVTFQPVQPGFPLALLQLSSDGGSASALLYGDVLQAGTLLLAAAAGDSPDFSDVGVKTSKTAHFTLSNPGTVPTGRLSITVSDPAFSIDAGDCNPATGQGVAPGGTCTFGVIYSPQSPVAVSATLSIQSAAVGGAALSLTGRGRNPAAIVAAGNHDFGSANIGSVAATEPRNDFTWTLQNSGDLATGSLQVSNSNAADFTIDTSACNGQTLAGGASCDVAIHFRPTTTGARTGNVLAQDATSTQSVTLQMTGTGVQLAQPGESCVTASCASGVCTGGVCCDRACIGGCQQCDGSGVCHDQSNHENCGDGRGVCFGVDKCLSPEGLACSGAAQCGSGNCERKLGGASANDKICCLQACAPGAQCSPDGTTCQSPTLADGAACGTGLPPCASGLVCSPCLSGGSQCTPAGNCCGGCPGNQVCSGGSCVCPTQSNGLVQVDCGGGRCITNRASACCDDSSCNGNEACNQTSALCGCPQGTKECTAGDGSCIPNSQCCGCTGPCQACNNGTCATVPNGQPGQCGAGQVCQNGACGFNNVGLGQACNAQANNCSVGSCVGAICQCSGGTPNGCGTKCVNFQNDPANCGGCGITCPTSCSAGQCNCPTGQKFDPNSRQCRLNDGQSCVPNAGTACLNGCTSWFTDCDGDGFANAGVGPITTCGASPPSSSLLNCSTSNGSIAPKFTTNDPRRSASNADCCDTSPDAHPGQALTFFTPLPDECVFALGQDRNFDYNCNGHNDGAKGVACHDFDDNPAACVQGNTTTGTQPGDIVPLPQVDIPDTSLDGKAVCGTSAGAGTCAFFTPDQPSGFGDTGCTTDRLGFSLLMCN